MFKYKLARIRPIDTLMSKADIPGFFQAIEPYLISHDPYTAEGDLAVVDKLMDIGKKYQVQTQWEIVSD